MYLCIDDIILSNFKYFNSVIYSILYVIQIIWYKYIFIHQLQQYKNKIVVQFPSYYALIWMPRLWWSSWPHYH